jgi:hypothetical protein
MEGPKQRKYKDPVLLILTVSVAINCIKVKVDIIKMNCSPKIHRSYVCKYDKSSIYHVM